MQIMMVPTDGNFFFTNDVLRAPSFANGAVPPEDPEDDPPPPRKPNGRR